MYAPDRLADRNFKAMSVAERGLLHTIELECWVNGSVPADIGELARILSLDPVEVTSALTERTWRYLERRESPEPIIVCPDLIAYREKQELRRVSMSNGGKRGADARWRDKHPNGHLNGEPNARLRGEEQKGDVFREEQPSKHKEWLEQYEAPSKLIPQLNSK